MPTCGKCDGQGHVEYEEDGRQVSDACYHCGTTGQIDERMAAHDMLSAAAEWLAWQEVNAARDNRNSDPEGEDWAFCAAENMMSEYEYTQTVHWDKTGRILLQLGKMPWPMQDTVLLMYKQVLSDEDEARRKMPAHAQDSYGEDIEEPSPVHDTLPAPYSIVLPSPPAPSPSWDDDDVIPF